MHVRILAPFRLPRVLEEAWHYQEGARFDGESALARMLRDLEARPEIATDADLIIEDHAPGKRATLLSRRAIAEVHLEQGLTGRLWISALGVASVTFDVVVTDLDALRATTDRLRPTVDAVAQRTAEVVRRHQGSGALTSEEGQIMWWHRMLVAPDGAVVRAMGSSFRDVDLASAVVVGDGYTYVREGEMLDEVTDGLLAVTEEWILVDEAYRNLLGEMARMRDAEARGAADELDRIVRAGVRLAADLEFRLLVLGERARYLTNVSVDTRESAVANWRLEDFRAGLRDQVASVRSVAADARDVIDRAMDERRNKLLYWFTLIAALQGGFVLYDFLVQPDGPITSVVRSVVAGAMLAVAGVSAYTVMKGRRGV